jgi:hypothetical protein
LPKGEKKHGRKYGRRSGYVGSGDPHITHHRCAARIGVPGARAKELKGKHRENSQGRYLERTSAFVIEMKVNEVSDQKDKK